MGVDPESFGGTQFLTWTLSSAARRGEHRLSRECVCSFAMEFIINHLFEKSRFVEVLHLSTKPTLYRAGDSVKSARSRSASRLAEPYFPVADCPVITPQKTSSVQVTNSSV